MIKYHTHCTVTVCMAVTPLSYAAWEEFISKLQPLITSLLSSIENLINKRGKYKVLLNWVNKGKHQEFH